MKKYFFTSLLAIAISCNKEIDSPPKSSLKQVTSFAFSKANNPELSASTEAVFSGQSITLALPETVKTTSLKASFAVSPGAGVTVNGVKQESGVTTNDFTKPLQYKVTARDGSSADFTVTVTVLKSSEKQILAFSFSSMSAALPATVNPTSRIISATVEADVDVTRLVPVIVVSPKATVTPASGVMQDFTKPVDYTVKAEDGTTLNYTVTIEKRIVRAVPGELGLHAFYKKYLDASGIPVVSSGKVPDAALIQARSIINWELEKINEKRPDVLAKMRQNKLRVAIMAQTEVTTDIPEHSDLYTAFPGTDWNTRARGLGATLQRPATSCAEENLLCYSKDPYLGEDILIHEFAHSIHTMGITYADPGFDKELQAIFDEALAKGLWKNTYAATNYLEYWAEGVQSWFDLNKEAIPTNGVHNQVNTRAELKDYDPKLYEIISRYFNEPTRKVSCHEGK